MSKGRISPAPPESEVTPPSRLEPGQFVITQEIPETPEYYERLEIIKAERKGILVLSLEPFRSDSGIPNQDGPWFAGALGREDVKVINVMQEGLPETVEESGIIIGGSYMSAYEDNLAIKRLEHFIRTMASLRKKILGDCFGHQVVAQAFGGKVERGDKGPEFGMPLISLTEEGKKDPLFKNVPGEFCIASTHSDVVTRLPYEAVSLAASRQYPHQATAFGHNIRTVQFHPEMPAAVLRQAARKCLTETERQNESTWKFSEGIFLEVDHSIGKTILRNFDEEFVQKD